MSQFFALGSQSTRVSASASVLPMNSGLISFRMDGLDLLAVQGTLKNLLQHHSSKASVLQLSAFFIHWVLRGAKRAPDTLLADSYWIPLRTWDVVLAHSLLADSDRRGTSLLMPGHTFLAARLGWESEGWHHSSATGTTLIHSQQDSPITFWRQYLDPPSIFLIVS